MGIGLGQFALALVVLAIVYYALPDRARVWLLGIVILGAVAADRRGFTALSEGFYR